VAVKYLVNCFHRGPTDSLITTPTRRPPRLHLSLGVPCYPLIVVVVDDEECWKKNAVR
jgi:hypothetical protein